MKATKIVLLCGIVCYAEQGGSNFQVVDETLVCGYSALSYSSVRLQIIFKAKFMLKLCFIGTLKEY